MLVFLQKHEFDWQIPSQIVFSDDHMKTSPGHCGHFGHRDAWFQWDKSMISAKRVLWKIFECRVCQFSRPPRLWIDTRPSRMAIYVQMAIPNSISHTNSIRKRIPDRFSDFSVIAISLQYWSCLPYIFFQFPVFQVQFSSQNQGVAVALRRVPVNNIFIVNKLGHIYHRSAAWAVDLQFFM